MLLAGAMVLSGCGNGGATSGGSSGSSGDEQATRSSTPTSPVTTTPASRPSSASQRLYDAVAAGSIEQTRAALRDGADPNVLIQDRHYGAFAPLHSIARNNTVRMEDRLEIIQLLLDAGADVNIRARADHQAMPIHWAARVGALEVVKMLVENGAEVNATAGTGEPQTPMRVAADRDYVDIVFYLQEQGGHL